MKIEIPLSMANMILYHGPTILVSSMDPKSQNTNIIPVSWVTPVTNDPPFVAFSLNQSTYSYELIKKSREFVINIPTFKIIKKVIYCGRYSGRKINKFSKTGLKKLPPMKIDTPRIDECIGHLECYLNQETYLSKTCLLIGEIVCATVEENYFDGFWKTGEGKAETIHFLGGNYFTTPTDRRSIE
jgi:flavin reductase (DIM6/NTAB) family NADH-FMN oxidoreductase RutF